MQIALGYDEAANDLKLVLNEFLESSGHGEANFGTFDGTPVPYPDIAADVAASEAKGHNERGVLLCGTGIGMAISADKVHGICAAQCHDTYSAERAQKSNNAQIISIGARVVGPEPAKSIVAKHLDSSFTPGPSSAKIARIDALENAPR